MNSILWFTGLPGSGKTTLARLCADFLNDQNQPCLILDGDDLRQGLNQDLGFSPEDRQENVRRVKELAHWLWSRGFWVLVALVSPYARDREAARARFPRGQFIEIFVHASLETCRKRDPKGLYKKAQSGEIQGMTGLSAPYEEPLRPELTLSTENTSPAQSAHLLFQYLKERHPSWLPMDSEELPEGELKKAPSIRTAHPDVCDAVAPVHRAVRRDRS